MHACVLIAAFNEEDFIEACVRSVLAYEGQHRLDVVVVDDQSVDRTAQIVADVAADADDRVHLVANERKGKVNAFNTAFENTDAEVLMFLGADDLFASESLDDRVAPLVDADGPALTRAAVLSFSHTDEFEPFRVPARGGGNRSGGAVCFNRAFGERYFPIPAELPNEDTWMAAVAVAVGAEISDVDAVALRHRTHDRNSWNRGGTFDEVSASIGSRWAAYGMALDRFGTDATPAARRELDALATAEANRRDGRWLNVLRSPGLPLRRRITFLQYATPAFYGFSLRARNAARVVRGLAPKR